MQQCAVRAPLLYKQLVNKLSRDSSICTFVLMAKEREMSTFLCICTALTKDIREREKYLSRQFGLGIQSAYSIFLPKGL